MNMSTLYNFRPKSTRSLTSEQIRAAILVDVHSGSDDERFEVSLYDSDIDKDSEPTNEDCIESEEDISEQDNEVPEQVALNMIEIPKERNESSVNLILRIEQNMVMP